MKACADQISWLRINLRQPFPTRRSVSVVCGRRHRYSRGAAGESAGFACRSVKETTTRTDLHSASLKSDKQNETTNTVNGFGKFRT